MAHHYPRLSPEDRFLSPEELSPLSFLIAGTCQLMPIHGAMLELGHSGDHLLWSNHDHSEIPEFDSDRVYDANLIGFTLRHVFYRAALEVFPEIPEQLIEIELLWVRAITEGRVEDFFDSCKKIIRSLLVKTEVLHGKRPTFYVSFLEPRRNYFGNLFPQYKLENIKYFVSQLNKYFCEKLSNYSQCHFFDLNEIFSEYGRLFYQDDHLLPIAHASFIHDFGVDLESSQGRMTPLTAMTAMYDRDQNLSQITWAIAQRLADNVRILKQSLPVKLIICDLDDTLWRGISGEKGQMTWDETDGWPLGLAEALLIYKARGGMLAICSKNEREPTLRKFKEAFKDGLKIEDFASIKINHESKANNIREILQEVNILPQNALFIDDNPREVDEVKQIFPDIHTLNTEPYDWRRKILFSPLTQVASISSEARLRTQSIQAKIQRDESKAGVPREQWLGSLEIEQNYSVVDSPSHENYARALELVNKTNQFNTNGQRWSEEEMRDFLTSGGSVFCTFLKDKMVDSGLISAFLYKGDTIVQGVLSCRVFGLASEYATMHYLTKEILKHHSQVFGSISDTGRNFTCHSFLKNAGFIPTDDAAAQFAADVVTPEPPHIRSVAPNFPDRAQALAKNHAT